MLFIKSIENFIEFLSDFVIEINGIYSNSLVSVIYLFCLMVIMIIVILLSDFLIYRKK